MRPSAKISRIALAVMILPLVVCTVLVVLAALQGHGQMLPLGVLAAGAAVTLAIGGYAKYPALVLALFMWIGLLGIALSLLPFWLGAGLGVIGFLALPAVSVLAGLPWGQTRHARLQAKGRATIEAEWVHLPRSFVRAHPQYRLSFGIWAIACALVVIVSTQMVIVYTYYELSIWPTAIFVAFTLLALWVKAAVASPMVYIALFAGLPFSIPFLFYWADGVRPNLIYRHRVQRLCKPET